MQAKIISKEEPLKLKPSVIGNRLGITTMAKHLWETWRDYVYPGGVGIGWQSFLGIVSLNWFRFEMWSSNDLKWPKLERQLARECKKKYQGCQFPQGFLPED